MPHLNSPHRRSPARRYLAVGCVALSAVGILGCSPAPEPEPTPTPAFASKEEAFAAAEETYRAYNDALNSVDLSQPQTFEPLYALSSGSFERADRENLSTMHAEEQSIAGTAKVISFMGIDSVAPFTTTTAIVCLDVSEVVVKDANGNSLVRPDRPNVYGIEVSFELDGNEMLIHSAKRSAERQCA